MRNRSCSRLIAQTIYKLISPHLLHLSPLSSLHNLSTGAPAMEAPMHEDSSLSRECNESDVSEDSRFAEGQEDLSEGQQGPESWEISFFGDGEDGNPKPRKPVPKFLLRSRERAAKAEHVSDYKSPSSSSPRSSSTSSQRVKSAPAVSRGRLSVDGARSSSPSTSLVRKSLSEERVVRRSPRAENLLPRRLFKPQTSPTKPPSEDSTQNSVSKTRPASSDGIGKCETGQTKTSSGKSSTARANFSRLAALPERKLRTNSPSPSKGDTASKSSPTAQPGRKRKVQASSASPSSPDTRSRPIPTSPSKRLGDRLSTQSREQKRGAAFGGKATVTSRRTKPSPDRVNDECARRSLPTDQPSPLLDSGGARGKPRGDSASSGGVLRGEGRCEQGTVWEIDLSDLQSSKMSASHRPRPLFRDRTKAGPTSQAPRISPSPVTLPEVEFEPEVVAESTDGPAHSVPRMMPWPRDVAQRKVLDLQRW